MNDPYTKKEEARRRLRQALDEYLAAAREDNMFKADIRKEIDDMFFDAATGWELIDE